MKIRHSQRSLKSVGAASSRTIEMQSCLTAKHQMFTILELCWQPLEMP